MCRLNGAPDRFQTSLRQRPARVRRRQHAVEMLAQLASLACHASTRAVRDLPQAARDGWLNQLSQLSKPDEIGVGGHVLYGRGKGPLIQGVDQIERGMASAPVERSCTITHCCSCLLSTLSIYHNL